MMEAMPACLSRLMLRSGILLGLAFTSCAQPQAADTPAPPAPAPQATPWSGGRGKKRSRTVPDLKAGLQRAFGL